MKNASNRADIIKFTLYRVLENLTASDTHSKNSNCRPFAPFNVGGVAVFST